MTTILAPSPPFAARSRYQQALYYAMVLVYFAAFAAFFRNPHYGPFRVELVTAAVFLFIAVIKTKHSTSTYWLLLSTVVSAVTLLFELYVYV